MARPARAIGLAVLAGLAFLTASAHAGTVRSVAVEGTAFRITLSDGTVLAQEALVGVVLAMGDGSGQQRRLRIDAVEHDPKDPTGEVMLYALSERDPATGEWVNACQPDPEGRRMGFPVAGVFTDDMRHLDAPGRFSITCTGGAEGKCIRFGYKPWRRTGDGTSLAPYYQACLRLVRADYCGDGVGHTQNGTVIDIFDRIGIQDEENDPGMSFEAAFTPDGASCVAHPRLPGADSLDRIRAMCPRLAGHTGPACDESASGLLFVRSRAGAP
jgi:hypothetical protein